jgi:hypothetical protein
VLRGNCKSKRGMESGNFGCVEGVELVCLDLVEINLELVNQLKDG